MNVAVSQTLKLKKGAFNKDLLLSAKERAKDRANQRANTVSGVSQQRSLLEEPQRRSIDDSVAGEIIVDPRITKLKDLSKSQSEKGFTGSEECSKADSSPFKKMAGTGLNEIKETDDNTLEREDSSVDVNTLGQEIQEEVPSQNQ